ncbi:ankyrin repeat domain-containing protein, partial [Dendrosporobacter sp. 1207_IL3150]|uniref:ankyrin repeat domain-containing protein n=1 Tax=Dendrosporobacter sp. 1207_IL3150 TaxID=3084054 RepID=UPI002FD8F80F
EQTPSIVAAPDAMMSPDDIEALLASMNVGQEEQAPAADAPEQTDPKPQSSPDAMMSPDDIEALLTSMNAGQEEQTPSIVAAPDAMMSPDDIEALLASMNVGQEEQAPAADAPEQQATPDAVMTPEEVAALLASIDTEQQASDSSLEAAATTTEESGQSTTVVPPPSTNEPDNLTSAPTSKWSLGNNLRKAAAAITGAITAPKLAFLNLFNKIPALKQNPVTTIGTAKGRKLTSRLAILLCCILLPILIGFGANFGKSAVPASPIVVAAPERKLAERGIKYSPDEFVKYAGRGNTEIVNLFLNSGMSPNSYRKSDGFTPLMAAASFGRVEVIDLLIRQGAAVNAKDRDEQTALMKAVRYNHTDAVKLLLQAGADLNTKDIKGNTSLSLAQEKKDPQILQALGQSEVSPAQLLANPTDTNTQSQDQPKISEPAYTLSSKKAGYMEIGKTVESLYKYYDKSNVTFSNDDFNGRAHPIVKVYANGKNNLPLVGSISIRNQGQQHIIDGIAVYDARFRTESGIGVNSTLGELRRGGSFSEIKQINETLYVIADGLSYELEISLTTIPTEWLKTGNPSSLPDDIKIKSVHLR